MALDLSGLENIQVITIYAPNDVKSRITFFHEIDDLVIPRTLLLGDFNLVTCTDDRASGNLDGTSLTLGDTLLKHGLMELEGT